MPSQKRAAKSSEIPRCIVPIYCLHENNQINSNEPLTIEQTYRTSHKTKSIDAKSRNKKAGRLS